MKRSKKKALLVEKGLRSEPEIYSRVPEKPLGIAKFNEPVMFEGKVIGMGLTWGNKKRLNHVYDPMKYRQHVRISK